MTQHRFSRTELVLGPSAMDALARARVAVFGIGGVGGYVVESLARSGVGALDIIDNDVVSETNVNRQIIATSSSIGKRKVDVMSERIKDINPTCNVLAHECFYLPETASQFDLARYDYVVDAVDTVTAKLCLIQEAQRAGVPIISCMGTGNKLDPTQFRVADINETTVCPLAKIIRKEARKRNLAPFKVVYSTEPVRAPIIDPNDDNPEKPPAGRRSIPGSVAFVAASAGLVIAAEVVKDLTAR